MGENKDQPVFTVEKLYVKDLSLEVPGSPGVFKQKEAPQIEIAMNNSAQKVEEGFFEIVVKATVTAKVKDEITFLVEASQAAIFQIRNVDGENLDMTLGITAPNIVYPYLRETISQSISRAGFPPVILQPMNFEAIYRARKKEQESAQANEATKH